MRRCLPHEPQFREESYSSGQTQDVEVPGSFAVSQQKVEVLFNDAAWGGNGQDRNLYVHQVRFAQKAALALGGFAGLYNSGMVATFQTARAGACALLTFTA